MNEDHAIEVIKSFQERLMEADNLKKDANGMMEL